MGGWHRAFIVISLIWVALILMVGLLMGSANMLFALICSAFIPPSLLYVLGLAVGWIVEGFKK